MCALRCSFYCDINGVSYSINKHASEFHATLEEFRVKIDILSQQFDYIKLITYHLELYQSFLLPKLMESSLLTRTKVLNLK